MARAIITATTEGMDSGALLKQSGGHVPIFAVHQRALLKASAVLELIHRFLEPK